MNTEAPPEGSSYTGKDILYREGATGFLDVQRAADALLRQGRKPSVAGIREQLGGGSPNTITPLLAKYWEKLGGRLGDGPESLERVPEALARVTELLWRRALEEARERLKLLQKPDHQPGAMEELQGQIGKLSVAVAEARAREGEYLSQLQTLSKDREVLRAESSRLLAVTAASQQLIASQAARIGTLQTRGKRRADMQLRPKIRRAPNHKLPGSTKKTRKRSRKNSKSERQR